MARNKNKLARIHEKKNYLRPYLKAEWREFGEGMEIPHFTKKTFVVHAAFHPGGKVKKKYIYFSYKLG